MILIKLIILSLLAGCYGLLMNGSKKQILFYMFSVFVVFAAIDLAMVLTK